MRNAGNHDDYMVPPTDAVFEEIKAKAIKIWQTYDDTYGYASEKIKAVHSVTNVRDNWGYIIGMFDSNNQYKLVQRLSPEARDKVSQWL